MRDKLIETIRSVPISGKTYEEYVEAVADRIGAVTASEVVNEILSILKSAGIDEWRYPVIAEIKNMWEVNNG